MHDKKLKRLKLQIIEQIWFHEVDNLFNSCINVIWSTKYVPTCGIKMHIK